MSYSLIIPIYNEERVIPILFDKINKIKNRIEIIIIDDGSDDKTNELLMNNNDVIIIRNDINRGKGNAIKKGISKAKNKNVILIDGDLEVELNDIPMLIKKYEENNYSPLVGIRWNRDFNYQNLNLHTVGNYFINWIFNILYKSNFSDVLCCLKILDKNLIKSFSLKSNGFSIETEIMAKLVLANLEVREQRIKYSRRTVKEGKKLKLSDTWSIIWTLLKIKISNIIA